MHIGNEGGGGGWGVCVLKLYFENHSKLGQLGFCLKILRAKTFKPKQ